MKRQSYYYLNNRWKDWDQKITDSLIEDVLVVARKELRKPLKSLDVLDVGAGSGGYSFTIEKKVNSVSAIEPYKDAYKHLVQNKKRLRSKVEIKNCLIEEFATKKRYDVALSIATLEHMPEAYKSYSAVINLLKPGGILYLTVPNKLWPIEVHYKLPFLSYLPLPLANRYVRLFGLAKTYEDSSYAMTYWQIKKFFSQFDCSFYFKLPDPKSEYIGLGDKGVIYTFVKNLGIKLIHRWPIFWAFSKGFIMVIKKNK